MAFIIGGAVDDHCQVVRDVYEKLYEPGRQAEVGGISGPNYFITTCKIAEMIKYVTNCFFASKITIMNEFYDICDHIGIDYNEVISGALSDERIYPMHTKVPGTDGKRGFGGRCFPKDIKALASFAASNNVDISVLESIIKKNNTSRYSER